VPKDKTQEAEPEQIAAKIRQVELMILRGSPVSSALKIIGIDQETYIRWHTQLAGKKLNQRKLLQVLEAENTELRKKLVDLAMDMARLREDLARK
jgi:putative transposase